MNAITRDRKEELMTKIQPLIQEVELWRKNKHANEPMPEPLWVAATDLAKIYGVSPVQRILRIDYRGLERRAVGTAKPAAKARLLPDPFIELPAPSIKRAEHLVELEDGTGRKLSVKVVGGNLAEVIPLAQAFWRPGL